MRLLRFSVLYMALALSANIASADIQSAKALREGDMKKLMFHITAKPASDAGFQLEGGGEGTLADYHGKYILLNFWGTWCAPCREEMPTLMKLQAKLGGDSFEVVTLALRSPRPAMKKFFEKEGISGLPLHYAPSPGKIAADMKVLGLPVTVVLNPDGQEIARLIGDADWASENAKAVLSAMMAPAADG
ncbi:MAG: TlpA family protein disulfide reductase [Cognatishimia sp.]